MLFTLLATIFWSGCLRWSRESDVSEDDLLHKEESARSLLLEFMRSLPSELVNVGRGSFFADFLLGLLGEVGGDVVGEVAGDVAGDVWDDVDEESPCWAGSSSIDDKEVSLAFMSSDLIDSPNESCARAIGSEGATDRAAAESLQASTTVNVSTKLSRKGIYGE